MWYRRRGLPSLPPELENKDPAGQMREFVGSRSRSPPTFRGSSSTEAQNRTESLVRAAIAAPGRIVFPSLDRRCWQHFDFAIPTRQRNSPPALPVVHATTGILPTRTFSSLVEGSR